MREDLNNRVEELRDEIIKSTRKLIQIRSIESEAMDGMPFGAGVNEALETSVSIARALGLETKNVDNYACHAEIGEGEEILGVLCHLDVVPEGKNWTYPPYGAEIHDNKMYGRGTIDNKGPAIAALYALKAIKDCGYKLNKRVRVILGTDEESGWEGLNYYLAHEEKPDMAFSPDAEYPVIFAEKGILLFKLAQGFSKVNNDSITIKSIKGGNAPNMVPDYCEARLVCENNNIINDQLEKYINKTSYNLKVAEISKEIIIESYGVSAHGSMPQDGANAISQLMLFLGQLELKGEIGEFINFYNEKIGMEYYGQSIGCHFQDDVSGKLIFNVGMIDISQERGEVFVNIRYPVTMKGENVYEGISKELEGTAIYLDKIQHMEPLYVPKDDPLVTKLMDVYQDFTADKSEPIAIGGGTYARAIEKAVAFGALFPGQEELAHQKDEYIGIDDLILNTKIFANAIVELAK